MFLHPTFCVSIQLGMMLHMNPVCRPVRRRRSSSGTVRLGGKCVALLLRRNRPAAARHLHIDRGEGGAFNAKMLCQLCAAVFPPEQYINSSPSADIECFKSRTCNPSVPTSTCSTDSATMRACSAGKSSSHSGSSCCSATRASSSVMSLACTRAAFHVPAMISGCRSTVRSWLTTAASISPAGTRLISVPPRPCRKTVRLT
jgi:hypothetical protein